MILRPIRTTQPQGAAAWPASPDGFGSAPSFSFSAGAGLRDLAGGHLPTVGSSLVRRPTPFGVAVNADGAAGYQLQYPTARPLDGASSITVEFLVIPWALAGKPLAQWAGANNTWLTQIDTDGAFVVGVSTGQSGNLDARRTAPGGAKVGELCHFFWTWGGGDVNNSSTAYCNGKVVANKGGWAAVVSSGTFSAISNSERTPISIGGSVESASGFNGLVLLARTYRRALSHAEVIARTQNPYMDALPDSKSLWVPETVSAGGGATTVTTDASLNYVLQAIAFQSQGGMYSILGSVNADINSSYYVNEARVNSSSCSYVINSAVAQEQPESYDVRSTLSATQNETYNILGAVTQSQNEEYNVLASLSNTQGSTYNVRSTLSQDQGSTYFISESTYREQLVDYVIRSAQFNDQGGTYNILSANTVGNNANLNYVISALIQQDQQENYLVRSSSHQETNGIYTIRASAENSTEGSYIVRGSLSSEAQLDYSVRAEVNSEGTLSYTIRASLSKDQGLMYDILAANNVASSSGGSYIIQATTANNTSCSYQIQGEVIDVPLTNAEMQQLYAWVSELVTKSATKEEIATAVWSKPTSELTVENSIGKWLMQKVLTVSKFLALK